jgi:hypothetical protein
MNITLGKITSNQRHQPDPVLSDPELTSKGGNEPGKGNNSGTFLSDKAELFLML